MKNNNSTNTVKQSKVTICMENNNTTNTVKQTKVTIRIEKQQYYKHSKTNQSYDPHRKTTIVQTQ
jgi:hypothetical protein